MTTSFLGANTLIFLTKAGAQNGLGDLFLDTLIIDHGDLVLTTTIRDEVGSNLSFEQNSIFQSWVNQNVSNIPGGISIFETNRTGQSKGELSIVDAYNALGDASDRNLIITSDVLRFDWSAHIPGIDGVGLDPNAPQLRDTVQAFSALLLNGAITPKEYLATIEGLRSLPPEEFSGELYDDSGAPRYIILGETYVGLDGSTFTLMPDGLMKITRPDGELVWVLPGQRVIMNYSEFEVIGDPPGCFLAGTAIDMWDGSQKPIERVAPDDWVVSYDARGALVPGRVSQVFQQESKHILDLFGLMVTPGHVILCGDGVFASKHVPIIDVLRSDGALVRKDGTKIRAATGVPLGDVTDNFIWAITGTVEPCGRVRLRDKGRIRLGTRFITDEGRDLCVADLIAAKGAVVTADGLIQAASGGEAMPFHWTFTEDLPKPEDYVLQRSALKLSDIYAAGEWDDMRPQLPAPILTRFGAALGTELGSDLAQEIDIAPNVPLSMRDASASTAVH